MNNVLSVVRLLVEREHRRVGDDVVDEVRASRTGISQIVHLDRCWTQRQDAEAFVLGMTVEVNRDIGLKLVAEPRDVPTALRPYVREPAQPPHGPSSHVPSR